MILHRRQALLQIDSLLSQGVRVCRGREVIAESGVQIGWGGQAGGVFSFHWHTLKQVHGWPGRGMLLASKPISPIVLLHSIDKASKYPSLKR